MMQAGPLRAAVPGRSRRWKVVISDRLHASHALRRGQRAQVDGLAEGQVVGVE